MSMEEAFNRSGPGQAGAEGPAGLHEQAEFLQLLYEFTERWQYAGTLDEIYEAALDTITRALRCPRASILVCDRSDVMRFVAWRGLSEAYRRAVDGHSPWKCDATDPQHVLIEDTEKAGLEDGLKRVVKREGVRALAFIPLVQRGRLLGKFMIYYDAPHRFSEAEINLALTIARQLGFSIERRRGAQTAAHLAAIVESSDDAIISKDLDGVIQSWNRGAEQVFGYAAEEAIGKPVLMLIPADRQHEEPEILARLRRGEKIDHYETVRQRKDGALVDVSLTVSPVCDSSGRVIGASKIARDISGRRLAERALRESERRLKEVMSAIPAAIYTTDADGKITYFNEAAVAFAGREPALGGPDWCVSWKLYHPDGTPMPHAECPMAVALKEGRAIRNVEAVAERPDGVRIPFIPYPTPLYDSDGNITGAVNMLVDISERKEAEANQRLLFNELNHRVKNNMQMIQSLLDRAARLSGSVDPRTVFEELSSRIALMLAAQRMLYAANNATHFSAREFLAEVCAAVQPALAPNVKIVFSADNAELSNDMAMPLALILNELVTNAAKYGVRGESPEIRVAIIEDGEDFILSVEDDGSGFDFEAVRSQASGLALVQGLARQVRGAFQVSRNPSCCSIRFPKMP